VPSGGGHRGSCHSVPDHLTKLRSRRWLGHSRDGESFDPPFWGAPGSKWRVPRADSFGAVTEEWFAKQGVQPMHTNVPTRPLGAGGHDITPVGS